MSFYDLSGLPPKLHDNTIYNATRSYLYHLGIRNFGFVRLSDKTVARIHIPDSEPGGNSRLRSQINAIRLVRPDARGAEVSFVGRNSTFVGYFTAVQTDHSGIDHLLNESLAFETASGTQAEKVHLLPFQFAIDGLKLGYASYSQLTRRFELFSYFQTDNPGSILLGRNGFRLFLDDRTARGRFKLEIAYITIATAIVSTSRNAIVLSLTATPRVFRLLDHHRNMGPAMSWLESDFSSFSLTQRRLMYERVPKLADASSSVTGKCLAYHIEFNDSSKLSDFSAKLENLGVPFVHEHHVDVHIQSTPLKNEISELREYLGRSFPMTLRFQIQKLAMGGIWRPIVVKELLPDLHCFVTMYGHRLVEDALINLGVDIPDLHHTDREVLAYTARELSLCISEYLEITKEPNHLPRKHSGLLYTYRARITPTSIYLEGPHSDQSNRVLRLYESNITSFLRVAISDENGDPLHYSLSPPLINRFKNILEQGIEVFGEPRYQFLGFSNSSLRTQSSWFCATFNHEGREITPDALYRELGDFRDIRSPALCASRIGQAFSDTTCAFNLGPGLHTRIPDIKRDGSCFSDGCGLISLSLLKEVWEELYEGKPVLPTTLQIRFGGAKGLVTLDPRLTGHELLIRESMWKFTGRHYDLEICSSNHKKIPAFLNHQVIKILEDMGVPTQSFLQLQTIALKRLMNSFTSVNIPRKGDSAHYSPFLQGMFRICSEKGWKYWEDYTIRRVIQLLCLLDVRNIKYRGRILVDKGATLFGIMDEYGVLEEGEVYVVLQDEKGGKRCVVRPQVAITRAPTMAPGDVQIVKAVNVPAGCPLRHLTNCVVFSQKGSRDLASQLGGGDLDGDLYSVLWDPRLVPTRTAKPAKYAKKVSPQLNRPVNRSDIIDFYLSFMWTDKLGEIATKHKILADQHAAGTEHPDCIKLAELASDAVDAAKFGHSVNMGLITNDMRERCRYRPDYMRPAPVFNLDNDTSISDSIQSGFQRHSMATAPDFDEPAHRYYQSKKALGRLYQNIDEHSFIEELEYQMSQGVETELKSVVWKWVEDNTPYFYYSAHLNKARELRDEFEREIANMCYQFSSSVLDPITELEVISGNILGFSGNGGNPRLRDQSEQMRKNLAYTVYRYETWIRYNSRDEADRQMVDFEHYNEDRDGLYFAEGADTGVDRDLQDVEDHHEFTSMGQSRSRQPTQTQLRASIPFAKACLYLAIKEEGRDHRRVGKIESFWIFAATTCVAMIDAYKGLSSRPLPDGPLFAKSQAGLARLRVPANQGSENIAPVSDRTARPLVPAIPFQLGGRLESLGMYTSGRKKANDDGGSAIFSSRSELDSQYNLDGAFDSVMLNLRNMNLRD